MITSSNSPHRNKSDLWSRLKSNQNFSYRPMWQISKILLRLKQLRIKREWQRQSERRLSWLPAAAKNLRAGTIITKRQQKRSRCTNTSLKRPLRTVTTESRKKPGGIRWPPKSADCARRFRSAASPQLWMSRTRRSTSFWRLSDRHLLVRKNYSLKF